ncbi:hypothetical protein [Motiliproteus sediminis]|uniref:hypothetical protein n=1 Tax=Motiliproteus sediminis TaxID=1468178 RepID=UPI001AEF793C|nr:hypothetical protein [Motiliproteus sediminis]
MNSHHYLNAVSRFLRRGSERKRLRQLSLAQCLPPHYAAALQQRDAQSASHHTTATR